MSRLSCSCVIAILSIVSALYPRGPVAGVILDVGISADKATHNVSDTINWTLTAATQTTAGETMLGIAGLSVLLDESTAEVSVMARRHRSSALSLFSSRDYDNMVADFRFTGTGDETKQFTVATLDDAVLEGTETFSVNLDADNSLVTDTDTVTGAILLCEKSGR